MVAARSDFVRYRKQRIELRDYQEPRVSAVLGHLASGASEVVFAGCPGLGKTSSSIVTAQRWLEANPGKRVLVLPHGTTVLRDNFVKTLESGDAGFRYAVCLATDAVGHVPYSRLTADRSVRVVVGLAATLVAAAAKGHDLGKFGLVIVDEGHERYHAEQVKELLKLVGSPQVLALTGTPSRFIADWKRKGIERQSWPIVYISMAEAWEYKDNFGNPIYANPVFLLATSTYKIRVARDEDGESMLTADGDPNVEGKKALNNPQATQATLEDFMTAVRRRFEPKAARLLARNFGDFRYMLKKTMFACGSIEQANQAYRIWCDAGYKAGVEVLLSESKTDPDSLCMQQFKDSAEAKILIVVDRGVLGYDCPDLANAVDMTGGLNPNRIFQFACRLVRWSGSVDKKYFLKIAPEGMAEYTEAIMSIVMQLGAHKDFYETFDGKLTPATPVYMRQKEPRKKGLGKVSAKGKKTPKARQIAEELRLFEDWEKLDHNHAETVAVFARTTLGRARELLLGVKVGDPEGNKTAIKKFFEEHGRFPIRRSKLGINNGSYCSESNDSHDADHEAWCRARGFGSKKKMMTDTAARVWVQQNSPEFQPGPDVFPGAAKKWGGIHTPCGMAVEVCLGYLHRQGVCRPCSMKKKGVNSRGIKHNNPLNTSKYVGVGVNNTSKKPWRAFRGGSHLGLFDVEEEAARAYDAAVMKHFGAGVKLNFPNETPGPCPCKECKNV